MRLKYNLKTRLIDKDIAVKDLADVVEVSRISMSQWINLKVSDTRSIPSDKLRAIACHLDLDMEDLYSQPLQSANHE